jgi:hypothetical protein
MNIKSSRFFLIFFLSALLFFVSSGSTRAASPWMEKQGYWPRTRGKLFFGLKNTLLGWMTPWAEAKNPKYSKEWVGFSAGVGEGAFYTAGGVVQLVTFFIPADFLDMGYGLPIPDPEKAKHPPKPYAPYSKK